MMGFLNCSPGAQQSPPVAAQDLTSVFKAGYLEKRRKGGCSDDEIRVTLFFNESVLHTLIAKLLRNVLICFNLHVLLLAKHPFNISQPFIKTK